MIRRETGFSLLELLLVVLIMGFVLAASSDMFVSLLRGYKQQSKIAETNIEGIIGLELLRRDIESAGYGLPWSIPAGTTYREAINVTAADYNDSITNPPRAMLAGDNLTIDPGLLGVASGSDYLVIKAINIARNDACTKWTLSSGATWTPSSENLQSTDRVIIISPGTSAANSRTVVAPSGSQLGAVVKLSDVPGLSSPNETRIVYGVAPEDTGDVNKPLWMPFNRADYYVRTSGTMPGRCAPGTGILIKALVSQSDGGFDGVNMFHLLDCVADMQVVTHRDNDLDGVAETFYSGLLWVPAGTGAAQTIRDQLKEVRVYVLAHEGQRDTSYTHPTSTMLVGLQDGGFVYGRNFDLSTIANWQNYRWKVYTLIATPNNLR
jgi:type II secretory pathway pseudopilin PulG